MVTKFLALAVAVSGLSVAGAVARDMCSPANINDCGTSHVSTRRSDFEGAIIVPGSEAANREVARTNGCPGCEWTLVVECDRNGVDSALYVQCNAARCPDGTTYRIYLQRPTDDNPVYLDNVCLTATTHIVTAAELAVDMTKYLTRLRPPEPRITVEPAERAVTGLATYFAAGGPATDETALNVTTAAGPATLGIDIEAARYAWTFGDGTECVTTAPGGPYDGGEPAERCDTRVAHVYPRATNAGVTLRATWRGTYTFDVGYGPVGPLPIPGTGVVGPAATRTVEVREARAQLVAG